MTDFKNCSLNSSEPRSVVSKLLHIKISSTRPFPFPGEMSGVEPGAPFQLVHSLGGAGCQ